MPELFISLINDKSVRVEEVFMNGSGCGQLLETSKQVSDRVSDRWTLSEFIENIMTRLLSISCNDNIEC